VYTALFLCEVVAEAHVELIAVAAVKHLAELILHQKLVRVGVDLDQFIFKISLFTAVADILGS